MFYLIFLLFPLKVAGDRLIITRGNPSGSPASRYIVFYPSPFNSSKPLEIPLTPGDTSSIEKKGLLVGRFCKTHQKVPESHFLGETQNLFLHPRDS